MRRLEWPRRPSCPLCLRGEEPREACKGGVGVSQSPSVLYNDGEDNRSPWRFDAACGHVKQSAKGRGPPCVAPGFSFYQMPNNGRHAGPRVLVVDDDPRCRAMIAATLIDEGFEV